MAAHHPFLPLLRPPAAQVRLPYLWCPALTSYPDQHSASPLPACSQNRTWDVAVRKTPSSRAQAAEVGPNSAVGNRVSSVTGNTGEPMDGARAESAKRLFDV